MDLTELMDHQHDYGLPRQSPLVRRGLDVFLDFIPEEHEKKFFQRLWVREFSIEDTGFPESLLQQWHDTEVIWSFIREEDGTPSTFTVAEIAWMHVVDYLLGLGLPVEFVVKVSNSAIDQMFAWVEGEEEKEENDNEGEGETAKEENDNESEGEEEESDNDNLNRYVFYNVMDVYWWLALIQHIPALLVVFDNGRADWFSFDEYVAFWDFYKQNPPHHFVVSLNQIGQKLKGHLLNDDPKPEYSPVAPVTNEELQVVRTLRESNYKKLTIHMKGGKIGLMEGEETIPVSDGHFSELVKEKPFQQIQLTTADGKLVDITRKTKMKF